MDQLTRYIFRQVTVVTLLAAACLTAIVWLSQALRFIDYIVNQGIGFNLFLLLTLLVIPSLLLMVLPVSAFIATLFVYNRLRQDSELTVMEAAGVGTWQRARPALMAALAVTLAGYLISLYLMPYCYGRFKAWQAAIRDNYASVLLQEGVFSTPVEGLTVFVRERGEDGVLKGILVHDSRTPGMAITMMAEEGKLARGEGGQRFELIHGNRQELQQGRLSLLNFDAYSLDLSVATHGGDKREPDLQELYLPQLFASDGLSDQEIKRRRGEAHQRILWPAYTITLTMMALAGLLTGEYNRRGQLRRVAFASFTGALLMVGAVALRSVTGQSVLLLGTAYACALVPALVAALFLSGRRMPPIRQLRTA